METGASDSASIDSLLEKVHGAARDGMSITLFAILQNRYLFVFVPCVFVLFSHVKCCTELGIKL